ncbi:Essential recombination function protein [uncultured Caudovirales phage]|uniref:Essential recombination function protein n=1 Tax=uncultured Caudovirales phage TaxID=2100421 RepID=A0A6J5MT28_9CAUD|nr:Essential recombination function protein [uncultured Caudovirales phage]
METKELTLNQKLSLIQKEFKASKSKFNSFGKYNFRSAEDILEALKPFNEKYKVNFTITESMVHSQFLQFPMLCSTASINDDLDTIQATAIVGIDLEQKGMQMPQKFGSASSYAKKYALGNLLLIDDTQDADAVNKHDKEPVADEKKFLNKNTPEFNKAIEYLKNGGSFTAIELKYKMTKIVKDELLKIK